MSVDFSRYPAAIEAFEQTNKPKGPPWRDPPAPAPLTNGGTAHSPPPDNDPAHSFYVTYFPDAYARTCSVEITTLAQLRERVLKQTATSKAKLPFVKLARFGDKVNLKKPETRCLRHDQNVLEINGTELDYDDKIMPFEQAVEALKEARVCALIYTSPTHRPDAPKWRVLAPTSKALPPQARAALVGRINGILGGVCAGESYTLSQAYYFGKVGNNASDHKAEIVEGDFVDMRDDLVSLPKKKKQKATAADKSSQHDPAEITDPAIAGILSGEHYHPSLLTLSGRYAQSGVSADRAVNTLQALMDASRGAHDERWHKRRAEIPELVRSANAKYAPEGGVKLDDFRAYMRMHNYIFMPTRSMWPAASVDARLPPVPVFNADGSPVIDSKGMQAKQLASRWLDQNRAVEDMTWAPGLPDIISDRLITEGGWIDYPGASVLNTYLPPTIEPGNAANADMWLDHVHKLYPDDAGHIIPFLAHCVQQPSIKVNHGLLMGGKQNIGKDSIFDPVRYAVGPWNFGEASPRQIAGRFNGFLKSVILRISEVHDLGDQNMFQLYDLMKTMMASPPEFLRIDEKHMREYMVVNVCGVVITTNHRTNGLYLPPDDRRHYVAWSQLDKDAFTDGYFPSYYDWLERSGRRDVTAYLLELDISTFDPKAPPKKTQAFWDIVDANRAQEDAELADVLDRLGNPVAITLLELEKNAYGGLHEYLIDRKNRRVIPHRLETCGYTPVRNEAAQSGLWVIRGTRQAVYARSDLSVSERLRAAADLTRA